MIVSDRELLELSAKAVGMEYPNGQTYCETMGVWGMLEKRPYSWWNPLTDDGDALRLAVKLGMRIGVLLGDAHYSIAHEWVGNGRDDCLVKHGADPYASTRRAIVLAAAEIGKEMK